MGLTAAVGSCLKRHVENNKVSSQLDPDPEDVLQIQQSNVDVCTDKVGISNPTESIDEQ